MSLKTWEEKILQDPGAPERVSEIEDELRLAVGLTALREQAGLSQRELAKRIGVSQPRVAAIERSRNVTIDVLDQYVKAVGGVLEVSVIKGSRKLPLLVSMPPRPPATSAATTRRAASTRVKTQDDTRDGQRKRSAAPVVAAPKRPSARRPRPTVS